MSNMTVYQCNYAENILKSNRLFTVCSVKLKTMKMLIMSIILRRSRARKAVYDFEITGILVMTKVSKIRQGNSTNGFTFGREGGSETG